jgi:hypothetical protein
VEQCEFTYVKKVGEEQQKHVSTTKPRSSGFLGVGSISKKETENRAKTGAKRNDGDG